MRRESGIGRSRGKMVETPDAARLNPPVFEAKPQPWPVVDGAMSLSTRSAKPPSSALMAVTVEPAPRMRPPAAADAPPSLRSLGRVARQLAGVAQRASAA